MAFQPTPAKPERLRIGREPDERGGRLFLRGLQALDDLFKISFLVREVVHAQGQNVGCMSNRVFKSYDDIVALCCEAWNKLIDQPWTIMSIGQRKWAHGF